MSMNYEPNYGYGVHVPSETLIKNSQSDDTETTELLSQLHKDRDYDMVTVSGSLVDNYFCNGPFDLSSVDMLDTEGTYPYAVFLERYQNAWSSIIPYWYDKESNKFVQVIE